MLAIGIGRIRPRWFDVDPGDECRIPGQRGLDLVQRGDVALGLLVVLDEPGVEFAQGDARELALVLQVLESARPLGVIAFRWRRFDQAVESFQRRDQVAELSSLGGR